MTINGSLPTGQSSTATLTILIAGNFGPPEFQGQLKSKYMVQQGESLVVPLPPIFDLDGDSYDIFVDISFAKDFSIYEAG